MNKLVIVESPNKCKKIQSFLGDGWTVKASFGHVRDLPVKTMGVDLNTFKPMYEANIKGKKVLAGLRVLSKAASIVYLATDPDREGEAIAWHLKEALGLTKIKRATFNEITEKAVSEGITKATDIDYNLVHAQEGRRILDRLVGYSVSPALSNIQGHRLSAGRVQSVAVRIVVERENEIRDFKPTPYIEVHLCFKTNEIEWKAKWLSSDLLSDEEQYWVDRDFATKVSKIREVLVDYVETQNQSRRPPAPFTTSSLQQAASVTLKVSPNECMKMAQKLFDEGLITYHRTDNPNLSDDGVQAIRVWLTKNGLKYTEKINKWKVSADAQQGHEAIRPTAFYTTGKDLSSEFSEKERNLYHLIWIRALASQMLDAIHKVTKVRLVSSDEIDGRKMTFFAQGKILVESGWMELASSDMTDEGDENKNNNDQVLPSLYKNQELVAEDALIVDKKTKPPMRYTEASLVKKLEKEGIGRPSTYASILENIKQRKYIKIIKRKIHSTEVGEGIFQILKDRFQFVELGYTREIEQQLDLIASGKKNYFSVVSQAYKQLDDELSSLDLSSKSLPVSEHTCPECNKTLRFVNNTFWGCIGYPECKFTTTDINGSPDFKKVSSPITKEYPCECGKGFMQLRIYKKNKFWGCSGYPKCKNTLPDNDGVPGKKTQADIASRMDIKAGDECPSCNQGTLIKRNIKNGSNEGKEFLGCSCYPSCKQFSWLQ